MLNSTDFSMFTWFFVPFTSDLPTGNIKDHEDNVNLPTVGQVREEQTYPQVENNSVNSPESIENNLEDYELTDRETTTENVNSP